VARLATALVLAAAILAVWSSAAAGGQAARSHLGTWKPPPSTGATYTIRVREGDEGPFLGQVASKGNTSCLTLQEFFWNADREGAFDGYPTFRGSTPPSFGTNGACSSDSERVNGVFWSPADDRLRVCPGQGSTDQPALDTQSPVDQSPTCTDFRRTTSTGGGGGNSSVSSKYIYRFRRDSRRCPKFGPRTYSVRLGYVAEDPAARFKIWMRTKKTQPWREPELYEGRVPFESDGGYRVATVPWAKKGPVRMRVRVYTEGGSTYGRKAYWKPCVSG